MSDPLVPNPALVEVYGLEKATQIASLMYHLAELQREILVLIGQPSAPQPKG